MENKIVIGETDRLIMREFISEDAADLHEIFGDDETMKMCEPAYGFNELKLHKIFAEAVDGVKSVGLMKKLGMRLEGLQRSQTKDNDGNWADLYLYGMLKSDWELRNVEKGQQVVDREKLFVTDVAVGDKNG